MDRQNQPRDGSSRDRILDAASEVFAEHGFAGARVDDIARRAEINKAMLYYHVGDKEALYRAVLKSNFERLQEAVLHRVAAAESPEDRLLAFIEALAAGMGELEHHPRIMLREIASGGGRLDSEVFARIFPILDCVRSILADGMRAGTFKPMSPILTHLSIVGSVIFITSVEPFLDRVRHLLPPSEIADLPGGQVGLAGFINDLLLRGLAHQPPPGAKG